MCNASRRSRYAGQLPAGGGFTRPRGARISHLHSEEIRPGHLRTAPQFRGSHLRVARHGAASWRGAVVHAGGEYAWLVYVAIHDHFHSEVKAALQGMRRAGTLGPSSLDELILQQQQAEEARLVFKMQALSQVLASIKESVAGGGRSTLRLDGLEVQIEVETISYEDWDVERDPQGQVAPPRWRRGTRSLGAKLASVRRTANSPRDKAAPDGRPRTATLRLARERTRVRPRRAPLP